MALSIEAMPQEVKQSLESNEIHSHINNSVIEVLDLGEQTKTAVQPNLQLMLTMPSNNEILDHERVSLQSFDSDTKTIKIECLIPKENLDALQAGDYYCEIIKNAIDVASDFFTFQNIAFQRDEYISMIDALHG